jgi:hypothetical protein
LVAAEIIPHKSANCQQPQELSSQIKSAQRARPACGLNTLFTSGSTR